MRIAIINDTVYPFSKGGAQKRTYEVARRLVQRGHAVHWYGMDCGTTELEGIRMHAVSPAYRMYTDEGRRIISQAVKFAVRLNIKEPVDIIDCMNFPYLPCFPAKIAAMRQHIPLVITWFEFWGDYWSEYMCGWKKPVGWVGRHIEKLATHLPDRIIADSEKVGQQLVQYADVRIGKLRIIPDGVDTKLITSVEPSKDKYDVVYVGRLLTHKNVDILIKALAGIPRVTAAIIGTGSSRDGWERLSADLSVSNRVRFLGNIPQDEDVYAVIKSSKVLVLPSTQEGHPLVVLEAYAGGIPVVGIKGTCDEWIEHGTTGYLSELHEFHMQLLIEQALELYPRFREPCLVEAAKYDWETIVDMVEGVYKELL